VPRTVELPRISENRLGWRVSVPMITIVERFGKKIVLWRVDNRGFVGPGAIEPENYGLSGCSTATSREPAPEGSKAAGNSSADDEEARRWSSLDWKKGLREILFLISSERSWFFFLLECGINSRGGTGGRKHGGREGGVVSHGFVFGFQGKDR